MARQESDQGRLGVETKSIIVQVDGTKIGQVEDRGEQRGEGLRDLV